MIPAVFQYTLMADTQKDKCFLVVRPLRGGVGGVKTPLTIKQNNTFFPLRKKRTKKYEPINHRGGGYPDLSGSTTKNTYFYVCVIPLNTIFRYGTEIGTYCRYRYSPFYNFLLFTSVRVRVQCK